MFSPSRALAYDKYMTETKSLGMLTDTIYSQNNPVK